MEVRAGRVSCIAAEAYHFAGLDLLVGFDVDFGEMTIEGLETVGMADDDTVAVAAHVCGYTDDATEGAVYGLSHGETDVNTMVTAFPAPAVIGCLGSLDGEAEIITIRNKLENNFVRQEV